jgi:tRNA dimethylallyltransferase
MPRVIALVGPTAVGKTDVAIELARRLRAEIVGCDSMQVYRGMAALTDQPTRAQRAAVPHHVLDQIDPAETFSVGRYRELARAAISDILRRGRPALLVGGTGLYLRALARGLCDAPQGDGALRQRLLDAAGLDGGDQLYTRLRQVDPEAASRIHPRNVRRVVRALEVFELTGRPLSEFWRAQPASGLPITSLALTRDRDELYGRIDRRAERMIADPIVLDEVRALRQRPLSRTALQVHGLRFILDSLDGRLSREQAVIAWKQQVRRYAKRQGTWFRAEPDLRWLTLAPDEPSSHTVDRILAALGEPAGVPAARE